MCAAVGYILMKEPERYSERDEMKQGSHWESNRTFWVGQ